jgi:hypothetical protein
MLGHLLTRGCRHGVAERWWRFKVERGDLTPGKVTRDTLNLIWKVRLASALLLHLFLAIQPWQVAAIMILAAFAIVFWLSGWRMQSNDDSRSQS